MTVKPIDLQVNISQMTDVAKNQSMRSDALAEQQHFLDKEATDKSKEANTKLEEADELEKGINEDEEKKKKQKQAMDKNNEDPNNKEKKQKKLSTDDRMGRIIDVLK